MVSLSLNLLGTVQVTLDGEYITCLRNHNKFTKAEMAIAKDYFLTGLSMKTIAAEHCLTYYHARKAVRRIKRIIADIQKQEPALKAQAK